MHNEENKNEYLNSDKLKDIIERCSMKSTKERSDILEIILSFYFNFHEHIQIENAFDFYLMNFNSYYNLDEHDKNMTAENYSSAQNAFGCIYIYCSKVHRNIKKAIYYLLLASKYNYKAQYNFGAIYSSKEFI